VCAFPAPDDEEIAMARSKSKHMRVKTKKHQAWKARRKRQKAAKKTTKK
jgi:hypothetical protein